MKKLWLAICVTFALTCLSLAFVGCQPEEEPQVSYLELYAPALKSWTPDEESAWALFPRYEISASLDLDANILTGRQRVAFVNQHNHSLREIVFRLYPNLPQQHGRMTIESVSSNNITMDYGFEAAGTAIRIPCVPPLEPGQVAELDVRFKVEIGQPRDGWVVFGHSQNIVSLPAFHPLLAVYDASGWRRDIAPAYGDAGFAHSAFYHVSLTAPADLVIAATGKIVEQTSLADGMKLTRIVAGPLREFVIIGSPEYEVVTTEAYGTTVKSYFMKGDYDAGMMALWSAASALRVYTDLYGPYPYSIMTVAAAPLTYRGMEYPTLNLLGIDTYRSRRADLRYLTIHEVAHQWWYGLVGNDPFNHPWLDEGLAEYSAYSYYHHIYGRARAEQLRETRWERPYEFLRTTQSDYVLAQPVTAFTAPNSYEIIVYGKAALFFDALRRSLGDEIYYGILQEYVERYSHQIVGPEHFFLTAQEVSGRDLTPLIQKWILSAE